jgi:hypothetical protein
MISDVRHLIATPEMVSLNQKISRYASYFHQLDSIAEVSIPLGRDSDELLHSVTEQLSSPYVHHTPLGWTVVGSICNDDLPLVNASATAMKTCVSFEHEHFSAVPGFLPVAKADVFRRHADDEVPGLSSDDEKFLHIVSDVIINDEGCLQVP